MVGMGGETSPPSAGSENEVQARASAQPNDASPRRPSWSEIRHRSSRENIRLLVEAPVQTARNLASILYYYILTVLAMLWVLVKVRADVHTLRVAMVTSCVRAMCCCLCARQRWCCRSRSFWRVCSRSDAARGRRPRWFARNASPRATTTHPTPLYTTYSTPAAPRCASCAPMQSLVPVMSSHALIHTFASAGDGNGAGSGNILRAWLSLW